MNTQPVLSLTLASFFFFFGAQAATITFTNRCPYTVWPGTLTGDQKSQLPTTGFELASGASNTVGVPSPWSGRFWARSGCSNNAGKFTCATADCGSGQLACNGAGAAPPATLMELTVAVNGGQDFYDVSNVDGFNVPMSIAPQGGTGACKPSSCPTNINAACPAELQVRGSGGNAIACKSACLAFNQPQYCCTGSFGTPATCPPTDYSKFFKQQCPDAYSYAFDDKSSTFTCSGAPNYAIMFCP
ncbi:thaumatin-like protein 1b [Neltuma alba]|uniref:thaumatin-like protein 1b n=1 Tax=Neltuma alba TaxID=207710 RepID=UPI0010A41EF0|nr:thaumatin-like protein 1b [Prosopis alba]